MSNGVEVLYMKGMNLSETENDDVEDDIWDDRKLNVAYDKALKIANAEVAKRVAMATNTPHLTKSCLEKDQTKVKKENSSQTSGSKNVQTKAMKLKADMPCRAIYEGDGQEYEATVLRVINDTECVVKFLGYNNSEIVPINTLKQTLGNEARSRQMMHVLFDEDNDGFASQAPINYMGCSDFGTSLGSTGTFREKRKSQKKKRNRQMMNDLSDMPMLNPSMLRNFSTMDMPLPPPPPLGFSSEQEDSEDHAISSMLLSWYMSGYYTGLYQGMKRAKENRGNVM